MSAFFAGWSGRSARPMASFLVGLVATTLFGFALLALAIGANADDPGNGVAVPGRAMTGILVDGPYPFLVTAPDPEHPQGHTVLLTGQGKHGVGADVRYMVGKFVQVSGLYLKRGGIDMLELDAPPVLRDGAPGYAVPPAADLGTWRIFGELCDGKCWIGRMRPGGGPAHKACANICLIGGVPPVLVSTSDVAGSQYLLPVGPDGTALGDGFRDLVGIGATYEGAVTRVGDLLVFRTDVALARTR